MVSSASVGLRSVGFARGHALRLRHPVADKLILLAVRIGGAAILADRQRVYQRRLGRTLHRLEQRGQKRRQLVAGVVNALHLAQVDRQLVKQDQGRLATEKARAAFSAPGATPRSSLLRTRS